MTIVVRRYLHLLLLGCFVKCTVEGFLFANTAGRTALATSPPHQGQILYANDGNNDNDVEPIQDGQPQQTDPEYYIRNHLKQSILTMAQSTKRGFIATPTEQTQIQDLIRQLSKLNPSMEPASSFYDPIDKREMTNGDTATIMGKWTLAFTNAPDITSLDTSTTSSIRANTGAIPSFIPQNLPRPPSLPNNASLGRIGQFITTTEDQGKTIYEIKNVIEWKRPDWLQQSLGGSEDSGGRVLQKVCCEAKASPKQPTKVQLDIVGFELDGMTTTTTTTTNNNNNNNKSNNNFLESFLSKTNPATILAQNPLKLRGPLKLPFGQFEVLYLDDTMRIIKTGQGYLAVNIREACEEDEWF